MTKKDISEELSTFRDFWRLYTGSSVSGERVRTTIREYFIYLNRTIEQPKYSHEDVIEAAEYIEEDYSKISSYTFESVCPDLIDNLRQQISEALDDDKNREDETLFSVFQEVQPLELVEDEISEAGFDFNYLKENVCREVKNASDRKIKESLSLYELHSEITEAVDILDSKSFKKEYNDALVSIIDSYIRYGEGEPDHIKQITKELIGELQSRGWGQKSFKEVEKYITNSGKITKINEYLRGSEINRRYCVPLPDTSIPKSPIFAGGVEFYMESDSEFKFFDRLRESNNDETEMPFSEPDAELYAVGEVSATTKELGQRKMENKLERAIDILNINQSTGVLQSPFLQPQKEYVCRLEDGSYHRRVSVHPKYGMPHGIQIEDVEIWEEYIENFEFFDKPKQERSQLESRFIQSFRWYGDAIQSGIPEDELLKYVIAMESLLVPEVEYNTRKVLATRLMNLLGTYDEYRTDYKAEINKLYELRNNIVHSAEKDIENLGSQIKYARREATKMYLQIGSDYIGKVETINGLLNELEEAEVPSTPED